MKTDVGTSRHSDGRALGRRLVAGRTGFGAVAKRLLLGKPIATEEAGHHLLPKILALPVFASDALSSNAYATEEILLVLALAGSGSLKWSLPIAAAVATVLTIVVISYRQTVRAYPSGGGAYIVAKENLGEIPGLVAAASLLTDYVLTVAVSIAAGAFALASLVPELLDHRVAVSLAFIACITVANLRGARESGFVFAIPTYAFVISSLTLIGVGLARCTVGTCPVAAAPEALHVTQGLTLFLVLRAFSSGSTALTGVEAIANGVPAFQGGRPKEQAHNAATTLAILGVLSVTMFVGLTYLAHRIGVHPSEDRSVVAQIAFAVFGSGLGFGIVQVATALILVLAANTAYQDFPRLSSILARDRYMPRQFINRGDRLVFSNGIIVLSGMASLLVWIYHADVTRIIQLYVVGVFTSFTLSQIGMVVHWRRLREPTGWRRRAALNTVGAVATGLVLIVVATTKFTHGAWVVVVAIPFIVLGFKGIHSHYRSVGRQLRVLEDRPRAVAATRAIVLVENVDEATLRAVGYARALRPREVRGLHVGTDQTSAKVVADWSASCSGTPLDVVPSEGKGLPEMIRRYVKSRAFAEDEFITIVVPETIRTGWRQLIGRWRTLFSESTLRALPGVVVTDVPLLRDHGATSATSAPLRPVAPSRVEAIVLASAVHNATLRSIAYAQSLRPAGLTAVSFNIDPSETARVMEEWNRWGVDVPLEIIDAPFRDVSESLVRYVRRLRAERPGLVVSVVIPEFIVGRWWHGFLHNQTALALRVALLFEPGVVVSSVPYHLD
ncbi:MAG: APC family permease [Actinomycetota bacterium]